MCLERPDFVNHEMKFDFIPSVKNYCNLLNMRVLRSDQICGFRKFLWQQQYEEWTAGQEWDEDNRIRLEALGPIQRWLHNEREKGRDRETQRQRQRERDDDDDGLT